MGGQSPSEAAPTALPTSRECWSRPRAQPAAVSHIAKAAYLSCLTAFHAVVYGSAQHIAAAGTAPHAPARPQPQQGEPLSQPEKPKHSREVLEEARLWREYMHRQLGINPNLTWLDKDISLEDQIANRFPESDEYFVDCEA